jgi:NAD(P)-dependent dehydrogenase (short-subunit alcohol dehydrogenase family)
MNIQDRFKSRNAIVTGGAQGIGRAIVERLAAEGAHIGILDRDVKLVQATVNELASRRYSVEALPCDITSDTGVREAFDIFTQKNGKLDVLVHSAGIVGPSAIKTDEIATEDFIKVCQVNLVDSFIVTKHAHTHMKRIGYGRILLIASIAGKEGNAAWPVIPLPKQASLAWSNPSEKNLPKPTSPSMHLRQRRSAPRWSPPCQSSRSNI